TLSPFYPLLTAVIATTQATNLRITIGRLGPRATVPAGGCASLPLSITPTGECRSAHGWPPVGVVPASATYTGGLGYWRPVPRDYAHRRPLL
ncbi:hypothetical protein BHM03_00032910, partial [Ensete ventricosum]